MSVVGDDRQAVVEARDLCKRFGDFTAIDGVDFTLRPGEFYGLLGANGAGKTTLIHLLLGLVKPTQGTIRIFGMELDRHRIAVLSRVNFASAYVALPSNLTVWENLLTFARLYGIRPAKPRVEELLERMELAHARKRLTGGLSSGQQTRLNLCKALLNKPELLFLDEPTASLDPDVADKVRQILREVRAEHQMAVIYTSHNMPEVEAMCDRIGFLQKGRLVLEGTASEILARSGRESLEDIFIALAREGLAAAMHEKEDGAQGGAA